MGGRAAVRRRATPRKALEHQLKHSAGRARGRGAAGGVLSASLPMKQRSTPKPEPRDPLRRSLVKGGLLAAATALGFFPACKQELEDESDAGGTGAEGPFTGADGGAMQPARAGKDAAAHATAGCRSKTLVLSPRSTARS